MPPEYVALSTVAHWAYICVSLQNVGANDVRFLILLCGFVTEFALLRDGEETRRPLPVPVRKQSALDLPK